MRHEKGECGAVLSPDGTMITTFSADGTARLWDAKNGEPIGQPMKHERAVLGVAFTGDGTRILTRCADATAQQWSAVDGKPIGMQMRHGDRGYYLHASFSADGQRILTWDQEFARLWRASDGAAVGPPIKKDAWLSPVIFTPDSRLFLTY